MQQIDAAKIIIFEENLLEFCDEKPEGSSLQPSGYDQNDLPRSSDGFQPDSTMVSQNKGLVNHSSNSLLTNVNFDRLSETRKPEFRGSGSFDNSLDSDKSSMNGPVYSPILSDLPNLYKHNGISVSENNFIKLNRCERAFWLMSKHPTAYLLLNLVAMRAQRTNNSPSGLKIGEALIGDYTAIGATRSQYRHALKILILNKFLTIIETCRNRKKATTGTTTVGTRVSLLNSDIWDINKEESNHRNDHPTTTERPPNDHEQERLDDDKIDDLTRERAEEKKNDDDSEILITKDSKGKEHRSCLIGIIKYLQSNKFSDKTITEAIKRTREHQGPIGNALKYVEAICRQIQAKNSKETSYQPKQKEKQWKYKGKTSKEGSDQEDSQASNPRSQHSSETTMDRGMSERPLAKWKSLITKPQSQSNG